MSPRPRRSYDQYCSAARALDAVGDRWTLLIVRELLAGPRRYTDLHADLPGVSTDVLASRLKDMEREGLTTRRRLPPPAAAYVYELTERGAGLLPVLEALGAWGAAELGERRPTDAVRAHWAALPLRRALRRAGAGRDCRGPPGGGHLPRARRRRGGRARVRRRTRPGEPDARLTLDAVTCAAVCRGELGLRRAVREGRAGVTGEGTAAKALREP